MKILVSGIAGDIGFNVGRLLRESDFSIRLLGIDIHDDHPGPLVFDRCDIAPAASSSSYISWLKDYLQSNRVDFFIPTSEAEIAVLSECDVDDFMPSILLLTNKKVIDNSLDKYLCMAYLKSHGVNVPLNGLVSDKNPSKFPIIVKPRFGQGSKRINIFNTFDELKLGAMSGDVWQERLLPDDQEYTCPVYRSPQSGTRVLIIKRVLYGGLTGKGEVIDNQAIEEYVKNIAYILELDGPMNVQLRLTDRGPMLFEINPRLSSTLVFRDRLGFCDLKWWLFEKMGMILPDYIRPKAGTKFYRGSQEYLVFP